MTQARTTKRALLLSCISMLLCMSMLVGTTFAWFTDTATTGVNTIVAGNLDIELEYSADMAAWKNAQDVTTVFSDSKWEPGYTEVAYFKVTNKGTLVLDYEVTTNVVLNKLGKNSKDEDIDLTKVLKFGIVEAAEAYETREEARAAIEIANDFGNISTGLKELKAGDSVTFAMVVWMPETIGNDANHNGKNVPEIQFGVQVLASQANVETDSFDSDYDADPARPDAPELDAVVATAGTAEDLMNLINEAFQNGENKPVSITLTNNIDVKGNWTTFPIPNTSSDITIDGAGYMISNLNMPLFTGLWGGWGDLTVKNLNIDNANIQGYDATTTAGGSLSSAGIIMAYADHATNVLIENCHVTNSKIISDAEYVGGLVGYSSANVTVIKNCSVTGTTISGYKSSGALLGHLGAASLTIENCTVTGNTLRGQRDNETDVGEVYGRSSNGCIVTMTNIKNNGNTIIKAYGTDAEATAASKLYGSLNGATATLDGVAVK